MIGSADHDARLSRCIAETASGATPTGLHLFSDADEMPTFACVLNITIGGDVRVGNVPAFKLGEGAPALPSPVIRIGTVFPVKIRTGTLIAHSIRRRLGSCMMPASLRGQRSSRPAAAEIPTLDRPDGRVWASLFSKKPTTAPGHA